MGSRAGTEDTEGIVAHYEFLKIDTGWAAQNLSIRHWRSLAIKPAAYGNYWLRNDRSVLPCADSAKTRYGGTWAAGGRVYHVSSPERKARIFRVRIPVQQIYTPKTDPHGNKTNVENRSIVSKDKRQGRFCDRQDVEKKANHARKHGDLGAIMAQTKGSITASLAVGAWPIRL